MTWHLNLLSLLQGYVQTLLMVGSLFFVAGVPLALAILVLRGLDVAYGTKTPMAYAPALLAPVALVYAIAVCLTDLFA